jgi:hypothetical protein
MKLTARIGACGRIEISEVYDFGCTNSRVVGRLVEAVSQEAGQLLASETIRTHHNSLRSPS